MKQSAIGSFVAILGGMYLLSAILLALSAAILWKMDAGSGAVSGAVIVIYIIVNFLGGFLLGGLRGQHKFFWGSFLGICYFVILLLIGIWGMGTEIEGNPWLVSGALVCAVTGMLGGMLAPGKTVSSNV